jgi:hypothetical protein
VSIRKIAGLAAGFALAVGLIGNGVSAQWSNQVTAQENITVGSFGCAIVDWTGGSSLTGQASVTFTAPPINISDAGAAPFSFTVKNTGTVAQVLTVSSLMTGLPAPFSDSLGAQSPVVLAGSVSHTYNGGLSWTDLTNYPNGATGNIKYTVNCGEVPPAPAFSVAYYTTTGAGVNTTSGIPTGFCRYATPQASVALGDQNGTASQVVNSNGSVTLTLANVGTYGDTGFYVSLGKLGALQTAGGYSITATGGSVGTNLYFDTNNDGQFATWNGAGCWNGLGGDLYGLGPSGTGTVAVNGSSTFFMNTPASGTIAFSALEGVTGGTTAISANTQVAVWVGITLGSGGNANVTITVAP